MKKKADAKRMAHELDHAIKEINRRHISAKAGGISKEALVQVAETVSSIRARYLKQVLALKEFRNSGKLDTDTIQRLRNLRVAYQEALDGYNALLHALQRGYLTLSE